MAICDIPNQTMLRWYIYVRSVNPEVWHIFGNRNVVTGMLSIARYKEEILDLDEYEDKEQTIFTTSITPEGRMLFLEEEFEEEFNEIEKYLQSPYKYKGWTGKEFTQFCKKA